MRRWSAVIAIASSLLFALGGGSAAAQGNHRGFHRAIIQTTDATQPTMAMRLLAAHNQARAALGLAPLKWNGKLSADAAAYAVEMARTNYFEHADVAGTEEDPQGENLWMGTAGAYSFEEMVGDWVAEKKWFRPGLFPNVTTTASWEDVGHYTQIIWHDTTEVGCAVANNGEWDYLVCRYARAGNWEGEDPLGKRQPIQIAAYDAADDAVAN